MKKMFILSVFVMTSLIVDAQNITGYWQGYFTAYRIQSESNLNSRRYDRTEGRTGLNFTRKFFMTLEIKQSYKALWGAYNTTDSSNLSIGCLCSISGLLPKKQVSTFDLYKERVVNHDPKISVQNCDFVNRLSFHYIMIDNTEYLIGKWFTGDNASAARDGSSGAFMLQHISLTNKMNVDELFPKLDRLLNKGAAADTIALKVNPLSIDPLTSLNIDEKEIILSVTGKKVN